MNLFITGRHIEITPALKEFAEDKLSKLERLLDDPIEIHVVLAIEKHRHMAEIQVKSRTALFSGTQETGDLYASIGEVADKLERQALKHKEKMRDHKQRQSVRHPEIEEPAEPEERSPRVHRSKNYSVRPLALEDALLELASSGKELLVYRDVDSERLNVVYRRQDGDFGLVDPEF